MNKSGKCMLAVARTEYISWITDPRMLMVGVLLVFIHTLAVSPLLEHADRMGESLNFLEPFIAVGNSNVLVMLIPLVFVMLVSDYPRITGNTLLLIHRTGKRQWYLGQVLFQVMAVVSVLGILAAGSLLLTGGDYSGSWSNVVTRYAVRFPREALSYACQLLPSNLYNQLSLPKALVHTLVLLAMYLFLLSEVMYLFQLLNAQPFGLYGVITVIVAGVVTCSLDLPCMWYFPLANTIVWLHYDIILSVMVVPIWYSYVYFLLAITILLAVNYLLVIRLQFTSTERIR